MNTAQLTSPGTFGESDGLPRATPGFGRVSAVVGLVLVGLVVAGLAWSAAGGSATPASHPDLFGGSLLLADARQLALVDLATGEATVQLAGVYTEVDAAKYSDVEPVPVDGGTYLVNRVTGTFNLLGDDDYVLAPGRGVGLGRLTGSTGAAGFSDGPDVYIVRYGPHSTVSLIDPATVSESAAKAGDGDHQAPMTVLPRGFAALPHSAVGQAGATVASGGDLWSLVADPSGCSLVEVRPVTTGKGLAVTTRASDLNCTTTALEATDDTVGLATTHGVVLFGPDGPPRTVAVTDLTTTTAVLPVTNAAGTLWYLDDTADAWSVFGVTPDGRVSAPRVLKGIGADAHLAVPAWSDGSLYTLDQRSAGQPALWVVDPFDGSVGTVDGARTYPAAAASERVPFVGAEVVGVGPRIVFNNPGSLLAVVVFTDGSHAPVVVHKNTAVPVSVVGPSELETGHKGSGATKGRDRTPTPPAARPTSPTPAFSQQVACAETTEQPYRPTISAVAPTAGTALISWTYPLLDPQDCEPDTWTVQVMALGGAPQPRQPARVDGQDQLDVVGLRPTTPYAAVVTAHIGKKATPSAAVDFETGQRGPDAPTSVSATVDAHGDWVVAWTPCRAATCLVPADTWVVTGAACGPDFVGQPPSVRVQGGDTSVTIPPGELLGASLRFEVNGILADGLAGNPTSDRACTQSWRAPNATGISVASSAVAAGPSVTATLQVSPATGQRSAVTYGSQSTTFVYHVGRLTYGPTTDTIGAIPGLAPNTPYPTSVTVYPTGHPTAAVTVHGAAVHTDLAWPTDIAASVTPVAEVNGDVNEGSADLTLTGLAAGGRYRITGQEACGSVARPTLDRPVTGTSVHLPTIPLTTSGQSCSLTGLALHDTAVPAPYGGVAHALPGLTFTYPPAVSYPYTVNYTQACQAVGPGCQGNDTITVTQSEQSTLPGADWSLTADQPAALTGTCTATDATITDPLTSTLDLSQCPQIHHPDQLVVTVTWTLYGVAQHGTITSINGSGGTKATTTTSTTSVPTSPSTGQSGSSTTAAPGAGAAGGTSARGTSDGDEDRTGPTALAGASFPDGTGPGPVDRSGSLALDVLVGAVAATALGVGGRRRGRRRRRPPCSHSPKGDR